MTADLRIVQAVEQALRREFADSTPLPEDDAEWRREAVIITEAALAPCDREDGSS